MLYAPETFTEEEAATLRPYFTNLDGPVFALTNLPEVVKGALFARYSRSDKSLRRLFLDEFVGDLDLTGDLTVDATVGLQARRGALRARVLRVRRRFRRAARRRAPRVRAGVEPAHEGARVGPADGVPRAVDALHPVRLAAAAAVTATCGRRRCASHDSARATSADMDALFDTYSAMLPAVLDWAREPVSRRTRPTPTSSTSRRSRPRRATRCAACCPAATLSNVGIYGTGQAYEAMLLRMRAHPLPEAAHLRPAHARRAPQGDPVVPRPGRPTRPRRRLDRPICTTRRTTPPSVVARIFAADERLRLPVDDVTLARLGSRRRRQGAGRDLLSAHAPARGPAPRPGPPPPRRRPRRARCTRTSATGRTGATSPAARSNAPRTASTSSATTARSAICSGTAC